MIDLIAEQNRIVLFLTNDGVDVIPIEKRSLNQFGTYLQSTGFDYGSVWSLYSWKVEVVEPSLGKHNSILNIVSSIINSLHTDRLKISRASTLSIKKAKANNIDNGFLYTIEFTTKVQNG